MYTKNTKLSQAYRGQVRPHSIVHMLRFAQRECGENVTPRRPDVLVGGESRGIAAHVGRANKAKEQGDRYALFLP